MSYEFSGADASFPAAADLTGKQHYAVTLNASSQAALCSAVGQKALGILQNAPTAQGRACSVRVRDISKAIAGGTVTAWDPVGPDASGKLVKMDEDDEAVLGRCLVSASVNEKFPLLITHEGSAAALQDTVGLIAAANYSVTGQYLAVKPHSVAGEFIKIAAANDNVMGVLQNAPAAGAVGNIKVQGVTTITAGTGNLAAGDRLQVDSSGKFTTATGGPACGFALAAITDGSTGLGFLMPQWLIDITGSALASAKVLVGNGSGIAAAVDLSGDATVDNAGAVTIANDAVSAAKMSSTVAGTDGAIFKSSQTPDAVTELDVPRGNVIVGTAGDVGLLDMGAAAGNIMVDDGNDPASVAMGGDATMAADGTVTIGAKKVAAAKMYSAAQGVLLRGDAANAVSELNAKTSGQLVMGDGTDVVSLAMSGDVAIDGTGDTEVSDLTIASQAQGDILRRGAAAWERLVAKTVGQILLGDGTDLISAAMGGDATIDAAGAVTLAKGFIRQITQNFDAATVAAGDATPLVLADFSALQTAGIVAAGDALIFHGLVASLSGGTINYDQNENSIIKYQTAGGGVTVSTTLANWFNGTGPDILQTIKAITTDIVPDADEDLVWTMSASPKNVNGDRLLRVTTYYSVYTPA